MHDRFAFVDASKRALQQIERFVMSNPVPEGVVAQLENKVADLYSLSFGRGDRACRVVHSWEREGLEGHFDWDDCPLFSMKLDDPQAFRAVVNRWLVGQATPSELRMDFPWLQMDGVADAYEQGRPIEGESMASWDRIEEFFAQGFAFLHPNTRPFLAELRAHGYDRTLRAGQSMTTFIVSRARRHGLHQGAPYVAFDFTQAGLVIHDRLGDHQRSSLPEVKLTLKVTALLDQLTALPVQ